MAEHVKLCLVAEKHQRNAYTSTNNIYVLTHSLDLSKATFFPVDEGGSQL